ncbi:unnamed protein product [Rhizoctonia solani]|uniref:Uncharacterized protein n=1 Tax=Rhizoctonia solani TaxID=456999 RepID=A0A8H3A962_9AGAM|nr:unnamed protein product [Rhizoctonia solani]
MSEKAEKVRSIQAEVRKAKPQEGPNTLKVARPTLALDPKVLALDPTSSGCQDQTKTDVGRDTRPSILGAASVYRLNGLISIDNGDKASRDSSEDFDHSWPWNVTQSVPYSRSSTHQSPQTQSLYGTLSSVKRGRNDLASISDALFQSIPPSINATQIMREGHLRRVMSQYDLQRSESWFTSPPPTTRRPLLAQLKWSKGLIWTIYLEVQLFQTLDRDPRTPGSVVQRYIDWIDKLEEKFTTSSQINASLRETADCLMVQLQLAFLKFVVVDSALGYSLLRKALPRFLHIVAADSKLYKELPNGNLVVLFHRVVNAPRSELSRFALYDTITALILGVPTLVEYGYDDKCDSMSHGLEWIHGIYRAYTWSSNSRRVWLRRQMRLYVSRA